MEQNIEPVVINLGCGFGKQVGAINVDMYDNCEPDVLWDLNKFPYPFEDNSADFIHAWHIFEHLIDWYAAFEECSRILKHAGFLEVRVPDESSSTALAYRDHLHVFHLLTFHGAFAGQFRSGTNAWAATVEGTVPLKLVQFYQVPMDKYQWMLKWCPWLLRFCIDHFRNFVWEQRFIFQKQLADRGKSGKRTGRSKKRRA